MSWFQCLRANLALRDIQLNRAKEQRSSFSSMESFNPTNSKPHSNWQGYSKLESKWGQSSRGLKWSAIVKEKDKLPRVVRAVSSHSPWSSVEVNTVWTSMYGLSHCQCLAQKQRQIGKVC